MPYHLKLLTVIETPIYSHKAGGILTADEREAVAAFVSANPMSGRVVRGSGGVRKVRWAHKVKGRAAAPESSTTTAWKTAKSGY
jgi:hypothetical protein